MTATAPFLARFSRPPHKTENRPKTNLSQTTPRPDTTITMVDDETTDDS